eukprot:gene9064-12249_t
MLREYLATARSQVQSVSRRIFNNIGLNDNDDAGIPIQNRIFSFLSRKFAEEIYAKSLSKVSNKEPIDLLVTKAVPENNQQNKFLRNSTISRHDDSKSSSIHPSFLLSLFFTFFG